MTIEMSADQSKLNVTICTRDRSFDLLSLELHRETIHKSPAYPDLLTHAVEIQDMKLERDNKDPDRYQGTIATQSEMIKSGRLWWEVSIESHRAAAILEGKQNSELGKKASWTPSEVVNADVISDLFEMSQDIVTRIDHVGLRNRGPAAQVSNKGTQVKKSEKTPEAQAEPRVQW